MLIWIGLKAVSVFVLSRFFLAATFDFSSVNSAPVHCSQVPQITLFSNFFIKNGSHNTIYTFKNYFATVFSVFSFQFQQNKFYLNRAIAYRSRCRSKSRYNQDKNLYRTTPRLTHFAFFIFRITILI